MLALAGVGLLVIFVAPPSELENVLMWMFAMAVLVFGGIGVLIAALIVSASADRRKIRELKERARLRAEAKTKQSRGP